MKKLIVVFLGLFFIVSVEAQERYTKKSGRLVMVSQVFAMEQELTVVFENFGALERTDVRGEMMGITTHNLQIRKDGYLYNIDMNNRSGKRSAIQEEGTPQNINFSNLSERIINDLNLSKTGTEEFLGRTCDVWEMSQDGMRMKGKFLVWEGISLRTDMEISGMRIRMTTKEIETDIDIDESAFDIPEGITISEE